MGRPRKRRTVEDYEKLLADGFGIGEKESYRPWIRIPDFASYGVYAATLGITLTSDEGRQKQATPIS